MKDFLPSKYQEKLLERARDLHKLCSIELEQNEDAQDFGASVIISIKGEELYIFDSIEHAAIFLYEMVEKKKSAN